MYTDNLRKQHVEILEIASEIQGILRRPSSIDGAAGDKLRKALVELSARVTVHLATEDRVVYPRMMQDGDPKIAATAKRFADEMGGIGEAFKTYLSHWRSGASIAANAGQFTEETKQLVLALGSRIQREERELYPLLD